MFRFDPAEFLYDARLETGESPGEAVCVVLDSGVCVNTLGVDGLELFSARKGSTEVTRVEGAGVGGALLFGDGKRLLHACDGVLRHLAMR